MLTNYLKIAVRSLLRHRLYSLINILGLAVGIAATILILSYIEFHLGFDTFQTKSQNLYRVSLRYLKEGNFEG